jgi:signal peptidase I
MASSAEIKAGALPVKYFNQNVRVLFSWLGWLLKQVWIVTILAGLGMVSYQLIAHFVFQSIQVDGQSMSPTLQNSGSYWLNRFAYFSGEPRPSDIIALKDPEDNVLVVKRIIALPGQSVYLDHGKVFVNGRPLAEPYLSDKTLTFACEKDESEFFVMGRNEFFVLGDNRNNSADSRIFGPVPRQNILGKVMD